MNGTKIIAISLLIGLIIGILGAGITGYYIFYRPTMGGFQQRIEQYRQQQQSFEDTITGLQLENKQLIDGIRGAKEDLLRQTGEIIQGTSDSITKLRKVAKLLQDYYNN